MTPNGTLAIAGTDFGHGVQRAASDLLDDMRLPLSGVLPGTGVRATKRYRDVKEVVKAHRGYIKRVTGHSLGASVAKQLAKDFDLPYTIFANPGVTWTKDPRGRSYRKRGDLISVFDRAATTRAATSWNPHSVFQSTDNDL